MGPKAGRPWPRPRPQQHFAHRVRRARICKWWLQHGRFFVLRERALDLEVTCKLASCRNTCGLTLPGPPRMLPLPCTCMAATPLVYDVVREGFCDGVVPQTLQQQQYFWTRSSILHTMNSMWYPDFQKTAAAWYRVTAVLLHAGGNVTGPHRVSSTAHDRCQHMCGQRRCWA